MADESTPLVLLVDPDRWVRDGTAHFLRSAGYRTLEAGDGRSGLRLAREHRPAVILLELVLPKLSGLEMLARLPGDPRSARIPVIIVSAYARLIDRGQVAGAHQKPYGAENCYATSSGCWPRIGRPRIVQQTRSRAPSGTSRQDRPRMRAACSMTWTSSYATHGAVARKRGQLRRFSARGLGPGRAPM
jgi:CheY-like chemotaxis protein